MIVYLSMTFIVTWIFWIIAFTSSSLSLNGLFRIAGSFMPSVMSIIITGYYYGVGGIKKLLKRLTIWRVNPLFYAFVFLYTAMSIYIPSFICSIIGLNYKIYINNYISSFKLTSLHATLMDCQHFFVQLLFGHLSYNKLNSLEFLVFYTLH